MTLGTIPNAPLIGYNFLNKDVVINAKRSIHKHIAPDRNSEYALQVIHYKPAIVTESGLQGIKLNFIPTRYPIHKIILLHKLVYSWRTLFVNSLS